MRAVKTAIGWIQLRDDETLLRVAPTPVVPTARPMDPRSALAQLTGVDRPEDIGTHAPHAGATLAANDDREFRRFEALFGRDALIISRCTRELWPRLSVATFEALGALQGLALEDAPQPDLYGRRQEASGRIPHESRPADDPVARQLMEFGNVAFPYFFSDDATPMYVRDLAEFAREYPEVLDRRVEQRDGATRTLLEVLAAAVEHMVSSLDAERLLFSIRRVNERDGTLLAYPVWQDSVDAHFRTNGDLAREPVAMFEVQVLVVDALRVVADLVERRPALAPQLGAPEAMRVLADELRDTVLDRFWVRHRVGFFAPGIERVGTRDVRLGGRKSTMGAALDSTLLDAPRYRQYVDTLVRTLFGPDNGLVTPWGIRTLGRGADSDRYRPDAYHNGSVWLFDNHAIARGLRRHGWHGLATWLDDRLREACTDLAMYPEFIRGDCRESARITEYSVDVRVNPHGFVPFDNRVAQAPQLVQGWTVAAYLDAVVQRRMPDRAAEASRRAEEICLLAEFARRARLRRTGPGSERVTIDAPVELAR